MTWWDKMLGLGGDCVMSGGERNGFDELRAAMALLESVDEQSRAEGFLR